MKAIELMQSVKDLYQEFTVEFFESVDCLVSKILDDDFEIIELRFASTKVDLVDIRNTDVKNLNINFNNPSTFEEWNCDNVDADDLLGIISETLDYMRIAIIED